MAPPDRCTAAGSGVFSPTSILFLTDNHVLPRYKHKHNFHVESYTWKRLGKPLDMERTLAGNGIKNETDEFLKLGMDPDYHLVKIHLYFKDDLTEG